MLPLPTQRYFEALTVPELDFLERKAGKQNRVYGLLQKWMLAGSLLISFAGGWKNIRSEHPPYETITVFSWENYLITVLCLVVLFLLSIWFSRNSELSKIRKDLRQKVKVVERVMIERKTFLPHNNTFHFYLNSREKLSIQVEEADFMLLQEGDEINIEYSKNAKVYFGYF